MRPCVHVFFFVWLMVCSHGSNGQEEEEEYEYYGEVPPDEDNDDRPLEEIKPSSPTMLCPKDCTCTQEGVVDCAGVDLREFPADLPEYTNHLSLQNNQIEEIPPEDLIRLYKVETLNLQNNRLTSRGLRDDLFEQLESLSYLYLANNKLTLAPRFLPSSLISADFAANYITKIYGMTFGHKPNLRSVYLHNNKLTDAGLPDDMFNSSRNVEVLIMSSNFLKYVPRNLPPALNKLHLKNNKLEKIPLGAFSTLSDLRELYLQNNLLTNEGMNNETFGKLNRLEYLDLSSNNLTHIPGGLPRNIVILHLEKNNIRSISKDVLTQIRNLEYLLLHNNKLRAKGIHADAFLGLKKLHTVHMYNNLLEKVPAGLPRRVKTLMLLHNQISSISKSDFATTYFLEDLNLSYNKIMSSTVHRDAFKKLRQLKTLEMSGNSLKSVPYGLPKNLEILKLKENDISSIPQDTLSGLSKLKELYLSNNKLKINSVYTGAWAELSSLQMLDLAGNQLSYVPPDLPESLEYLYLQNNRIVMVTDNAFESTPNIKRIFLRFNLLTPETVKERAFYGLEKLQVLDIESSLALPKVFNKKEAGREKEKEEEEEQEEEEED
ncbi:podocan isoform X1 [Pelobates cultripes]|uniref:Podocan isoform X1 n=2 Tax=Pelobates cultripes TaxID=61616 RepID=A0AAD1SSM5_PELCU|nr:podocan isoform X1 [Pelobates cultripes]